MPEKWLIAGQTEANTPFPKEGSQSTEKCLKTHKYLKKLESTKSSFLRKK